MNKLVSYGPALVVLLAVCVVLVAGPMALRSMELAQVAASVEIAQHRLETDNPLEALDCATRDIADSVLPGTVNIEVNSEVAPTVPEPSPEDAPNRQVPPLHERALPSTGSGWMYDNLGHIVTNAHVVRGARSLRVELFDGRVSTAEVVGVDTPTDIAVIKIDPGSRFFPLRRAVDKPIRVGDHVFAVGSPFGFKFTMSQGIVSGIGRSEAASFVGMLGGYTNFIQTDAAMNPGNSGGPLVNVRGEVIGMAAAIANSRTEGGETVTQGQNAGLGFAIPLETIDAIVQQLVSSDVVLRGYLGITLDLRGELDPDTAAQAGYVGRGVLVSETPGDDQPAGKAGLKQGDIITSIDGRPISSRDVLRSIVSIKSPGDKVEITYWRDHASHTTTATLGAAFVAGRGLRVVPGSDAMTPQQVREWIAGQKRR